MDIVRCRAVHNVTRGPITASARNITAAVATTGSTVSGTRALDAFGNARTAATGSLATSAIGFAGQYLEAVVQVSDINKVGWKPVWDDPRFQR